MCTVSSFKETVWRVPWLRQNIQSGKRRAFLKVALAGIGSAAVVAGVPSLAKAASEYEPVRVPESAAGDKFNWLNDDQT